MNHIELGQFGEALAERLLLEKGYLLLNRNYRFKKYELDLIMEYLDQIIVVEVKTRNTAAIGEPYKAVTRTKQGQIIKATNHFLQANEIDKDVRFDIVSIVHNTYRTSVEHIEGAFFPLL